MADVVFHIPAAIVTIFYFCNIFWCSIDELAHIFSIFLGKKPPDRGAQPNSSVLIFWGAGHPGCLGRCWSRGALFENVPKTRSHGCEEDPFTRWFNVTFLSPSWRSLNLQKGHLTIPKRSQWIARLVILFHVFGLFSKIQRNKNDSYTVDKRTVA